MSALANQIQDINCELCTLANYMCPKYRTMKATKRALLPHHLLLLLLLLLLYYYY